MPMRPGARGDIPHFARQSRRTRTGRTWVAHPRVNIAAIAAEIGGGDSAAGKPRRSSQDSQVNSIGRRFLLPATVAASAAPRATIPPGSDSMPNCADAVRLSSDERLRKAAKILAVGVLRLRQLSVDRVSNMLQPSFQPRSSRSISCPLNSSPFAP